MPFWGPRRHADERLIWSRDRRLVTQLVAMAPGSQLLELDSGWCLIGPAALLNDGDVAVMADMVPYGIVTVDNRLPERERYVYALATAVQLSGLANRIGMDQSPMVVQTKLLDYFFTLMNASVFFQPIVRLATGDAYGYECLTRPGMMRPQVSVGEIVEAAIATGRTVEFDLLVLSRVLSQAEELKSSVGEGHTIHLAINLAPASMLDSHFDAKSLATRIREAGLHPRQITLEVTEQQAIPDVDPLKRQVKALRRLGFGFAVDDAGAGYASFSRIAALRPSEIKIDKEIVHGVYGDDAKQALVEAFVSFSRRIGAMLVAEGIETRRDLAALIDLGVEFGQGYLLGKAAPVPQRPRRIDPRRIEAARSAIPGGLGRPAKNIPAAGGSAAA